MKRYCGRRVSGEEIGQLCALIADHPGRTRAQLSRLACRLLQWRKADGGLKEMSCRVAMLRLHREGRWCMNRNWPATNPTHRSITYQERTTMAYRARPSG